MTPRTDDAGVTMIELIIVLVVSSILLALVSVMFATTLTAQRQTTERDLATAQLNAVTASITESVRASADSAVSESGQRLDATVLLSDGESWECRAWRVLDAELLFRTIRGGVSSSWTALATGVRGNLASGAAFAASDSTITLGLTITRGETVVALTDGAHAQVVTEEVPSC